MFKVVVIGRGCVGATVLNNIQNAGNVYSLMDRDRYSRFEPVFFNGNALDVETITPSNSFKADLIINTVKNFSLEDTLPLMDDFVGENTLILPLQNGLESEDILRERYGDEAVINAFISKLSTVRSGHEVTSFSPGVITFGEKDGKRSGRTQKLESFFKKTVQEFVISSDIIHDQWVKFMTNTCFNSLTALMEYDYGTFMKSDNLIRAVRLEAKEVLLVAAREGVTITQEDIEGMIRSSLSLPQKGRSSMCDDVIEGRMTENRWFCGTLSMKAKKHGVKTPLTDFLYILLEAKSGR